MITLGPEMRSTGEVMGISDSFGSAFAKAQLAAANGLPLEGGVLITVNDSDKGTVTPIARRFHEMGFRVIATRGTAAYLRARGIPADRVLKVHEGRPNCLDMIVNHDVQLLINTPLGKHAQLDDYLLRQAAIVNRVSYTTTMSAASAASDAILSLRSRRPRVRSLQEWQSDVIEAREATTAQPVSA
jgi:carbamoyl-phosphate synthase large subunit